MIYLFIGKDINILNKKIDDLIKELNINNIIKYDYSEITMRDIIEEVNYVDLFNEKKLVIVSYFTFKNKKEDSKDDELLIKYLENPSENVVILKCIDDSLDERKKVIKLLKEKGTIIKCEKLDYYQLRDYIENLFKDSNKKIGTDCLSRLLFLCDNIPDICINEANKLLLYIGENKEVTIEDINKVVTKSTEKEIFSFNEYILSKNIGKAIDSYKTLKEKALDETVIIDSIAKQYRMLYQTKELLNTMSYKDVAHTLGVNEYVIQKIVPFTSKYTNDEILDLLYKTSLLDEKIKILGYNPERVMTSFITTI